MVRPVSSSTIPHPATRPASSAPAPQSTPDTGHPHDGPVGQQAKAEIAKLGADLPKNVQGKIASGIARGLDIESILNLQEASEPGGDVPIDAIVDDPVAGDPVAGDPVASDPVVDDPVVDDPVVDDPIVADPVVDDPIAGETAGEDAVVDVLLDTPDLTEPAAEPEPEVAPIELPVPEDLVLDPELTDPLVDGGDTEIT